MFNIKNYVNPTLLAVVLACVFMLTLCGGCFVTTYKTSSGYRDGYVQKMSQPTTWGVFWTHEGELALAGFGGNQRGKAGNAQYGNVWAFSVTDDKVVEEISKFSGDELVRLHYHERPYTLPWEGDTGYFVHKVEKREHHQ